MRAWGLACSCGGPDAVTPAADADTQSDAVLDVEGAADAAQTMDDLVEVDEIVEAPPIPQGIPCSALPEAPARGPEGEPVTDVGPCQVPAVLPDDPLVYVESAPTLRDPVNDFETAAFVSHIIDLDVEPDTGFVYVASLPGFFVFGPTEDGFRHLGAYPALSPMGATSWQQGEALYGEVVEYAHVEVLGGGIVATTARGNPPPEFMFGPDHFGIYGLFLLDVSVPTHIEPVGELLIPDLAGMVHVEPYLYTLSYMGELLVVDISDRSAPVVLSTMTGLGNPWKMAVVGDIAYVADTKLGLVVVDLGDPLAPQIVATVPTASGLQDVAHDDGVVYAAAGSAGVEIFSVADPVMPVCIASVHTGPSAVGVAADNGFLWVTNHEGVLVYDVSDPTAPVSWAVEATDGWALHVVAHGDEAYIADWEFIHRMAVSREIQAPEADLNPEALYFWDETTTRTFSIRNRGSVDLDVVGLTPSDPRVTVALSRTVIPPRRGGHGRRDLRRRRGAAGRDGLRRHHRPRRASTRGQGRPQFAPG